MKTIFINALKFIVTTLAVFTVSNATYANELDIKEQHIIPIAAFAAAGQIEQLKISLNEGLDSGLTINEIKEMLVELYAYAGFPRSLNGLSALMNVIDERKAQGITDPIGKNASALPTKQTSLEFGTTNQTKLIGVEVKGPLFDFSPTIDQYLKAHLFGDIFQRDVLTWKQREIATIAMLSSISGVNSQLSAHYRISMNNQVTVPELKEFITILKSKVNEDVANNAEQVLNKALQSN
jgi:4-carboxymuconolactone decarboxylase